MGVSGQEDGFKMRMRFSFIGQFRENIRGIKVPVFRGWTVSADHQVPVKRPLASPNILCFPSCLHSSAAHMATAQHCAGRCVSQCRVLIGAEETVAPQPQEVHCNPSSTQSKPVKAAVASMQSPDRNELPVARNIKTKDRLSLLFQLRVPATWGHALS